MVFGFSEKYIVEKLAHKDYQKARQGFLALKQEALDNYKQQALLHHPDRGGDENKMKELNAAHDVLKGLEPMPTMSAPPKPRPRPQRSWGGFWSSPMNGSTATTGSTSSFYGGGFTIHINVV